VPEHSTRQQIAEARHAAEHSTRHGDENDTVGARAGAQCGRSWRLRIRVRLFARAHDGRAGGQSNVADSQMARVRSVRTTARYPTVHPTRPLPSTMRISRAATRIGGGPVVERETRVSMAIISASSVWLIASPGAEKLLALVLGSAGLLASRLCRPLFGKPICAAAWCVVDAYEAARNKRPFS